jgi:hypothetical protein
MSISTYDLVWATAQKLESYIQGRATGGSATTLADTFQLGSGGDDLGYIATQLQGATLLANGGTSKYIRLISSYDPATATLTLATTISPDAFGEGADYLVLFKTYPVNIVIGKLNEALREYGDVIWEDITQSTVSNQRRYSYTFTDSSADQRTVRLLEVWLAQNTAEPYDWQRVLGVRRVPPRQTADNEYLQIEFPYDPTAGRLIKVVYSFAPYLIPPFNYFGSQDSKTPQIAGTLEGPVDAQWIATEAAARCVRWRLNQAGDDSEHLTSLLNDLVNRAGALRQRRNPHSPIPQPILAFTDVG